MVSYMVVVEGEARIEVGLVVRSGRGEWNLSWGSAPGLKVLALNKPGRVHQMLMSLAYKSVPYPSNQQSPVPQRRLHPNLQTSSGDSPGLIRCVVLETW